MNRALGYIRWIIFLVAGVVILFFGIREKSAMNTKAIDLNDESVEWSELKVNDHVEMDIDFIMDYFMTTTDDGKETMRDYLMPRIELDDGYYNFSEFIGVHVGRTDDFGDYDRLADDSLDWWNGDDLEKDYESIHIDGLLRKMTSDQKKYCTEYLDEMGYSQSEIDDMMTEYVIYPDYDNSNFVLWIGVALAAIGAVALVIKAVRGNR